MGPEDCSTYSFTGQIYFIKADLVHEKIEGKMKKKLYIVFDVRQTVRKVKQIVECIAYAPLADMITKLRNGQMIWAYGSVIFIKGKRPRVRIQRLYPIYRLSDDFHNYTEELEMKKQEKETKQQEPEITMLEESDQF